MPSASQPQNRKSKLWAINPRKQTRRKPARNKPKPAAPPHRRRRPWSASRLPARKSNRLSSAVSLGIKIWGDGFFFATSPELFSFIFISIQACSITIRLNPIPSFTDTEFYVWPGLCRSRVATRLSRLLKLASQKTIGYEFESEGLVIPTRLCFLILKKIILNELAGLDRFHF
jgi:hypothetical protein